VQGRDDERDAEEGEFQLDAVVLHAELRQGRG
jgi:hypothetical protein